MPEFPMNPAGYKYRPLKRGLQGWDVYALQTALTDLGYSTGGLDGDFGPATHLAVVRYQSSMALTPDGIAGVVTQRSLAIREAAIVSERHRLPQGAMKGQIEAESAFILGNHSPLYDGKFFDVGVAQRSTRYTPMAIGYDAPKSLGVLGQQLRDKYDLYKSYGRVTSERRLWELAQGSWNAPSWTETLAKGGTLNATNRQWVEDYIDRVSVYLVV